MKINQNISAVIVNDQLLRNENSLSASVKKLSSGFKFNDPKDNPSGMAISFKMQAQIHALNRASLNATDGVSMVETIDGAMGEMTEILQRIRELCVQAGNDTNTMEDREAIQQEIDALKEEVNRISTATEFNGKKVLDGSLDRRTYVTSEETLPGGGTKEVSMYDKITNVIISDEVQAGDYPVTIDKAAEHATMIAPAPPATAIPATGKIEESMEGTISINGSKVEIKAGMTADEVYEAIRDAGEMGWVNVFATDGTQTLPLNVDNLDTQGYNKMPGGYQFGVQLGFVSQNYGSDESVTITCDNDQLAALLGIDGLPNATRTETIEYNWQTFGIEGDPNNAANPPQPAQGTTAGYTGTETKFTKEGEGTLYINGIAVAIKEGMTADQAYQAIAKALDKSGVTVGISGKNPAVDAFEFSDKLIFTTDQTGIRAEINIKYDNDQIGELLGLNGLSDVSATPPPTREIVSVEYKAVQKGEDAQVTIKDGNGIREEYTGQAVIRADGNQVVITDKSGFEMSFEVRGDIENTEIKIEATDIGTLQLQIGANEGQELAVRVPILNTQSLYMDDLDVRKVGGPDRGMNTMDGAIAIVSAARSLMGAYENRLDYIQSNLDESEENMTKAVSRLGDVDMAEEMTEYTNANVLTQASISVLAQANDLPQQVLSLLQG
jgi:flagellin